MVLGYHEFALTPSADIYCMTPETFLDHLRAIKAVQAYPQAPPREYDDPAAEITVTFDDAHVSQLRHALPVLERTNTVGHFFVPTRWVGRSPHTATWNDLRELVRLGHRVGSHSHRHALLTHCATAVLRDELITSKMLLEDQLGEPIDSISMPGGRYNRRVLAECQDAGYRRIFTSRPQSETRAAIPLHCVRDGSATVTGRLIVRRTLPLHIVTGYLHAERSTVRLLQLGYSCRRAAKAVAGDVVYQTIWRALLRRMRTTQPAEQAT